MKPIYKVPVIGVMAFMAFALLNPGKVEAQAHMNISMQTFYDELSPYGRWIHNPQYGYVWLPYAEPGFQPYATRGYWVMTEYGNTWVSDYEWGWAPFHYGRWYFDNYYGWAWVPGNVWGPAWVHWRSSRGYYGWAPLGPGVHINVAVNIPMNHWVFVPHVYITSPRIYNYYVPRRRVTNIYRQTVIVNNVYTTNNYTYVSGPSRNEIERTTRKPVQVRQISNVEKPTRSEVNDRTVRVYRPRVTEETTARPAKIEAGNGNTPSRRENQTRQPGVNTSSPQNRSAENPTRQAPRQATRQPSQNNTETNRTSPRQNTQQESRQAPVQRREETQSQTRPPVQRSEQNQTRPPAQRSEQSQTRPPAQRSEQTPSRTQVQRKEQSQSNKEVNRQQRSNVQEKTSSPEPAKKAPSRRER